MKIKDIYNFLNNIAPFHTSSSWDNCGLLIGNEDEKLTTALLTLDVTDSVIQESIEKNANLIISHHPIIFNPLKKIPSDSLVHKIIRNNINIICLHTNLDMAKNGVNDILAKIFDLNNVFPLSLEPPYSLPLGVIGTLPSTLTPQQLALLVKEKLKCSGVKFIPGSKPIKKLALCGGSGASLIKNAIEQKVDAFITSEIKHSIWIKAKEFDITLIDADHFYTENVIIPELYQSLIQKFPNNTNNFKVAANNVSYIEYL